ncbi:glycoside hydrolase family 18 [Niabella pedocola]|uniref:Glycoside hydrolase family 18 n=1 Tax=Niabella pedocola TaxID=1752077 RepID=A0ABS8PLR0_9BACT|nr:glycoside hydrolase family 18 [Niabella pedocola]MCD2421810.1 glycoside hydrolase family 18 [Niabella pedocola]
MKTYRIYLFLLPLLVFAACSKDWTEAERKDITGLGFGLNPQTTKSAEYYEALRSYKKSDHPVTFGWFGNWTGTGSSLANSLAGLPDSTDFVSLWGGWKNLNEAQKSDLKFVQTVKGTRCLAVFIVANLGDGLTPAPYNKTQDSTKLFWGWKDSDDGLIDQAIEKYAGAILDTINKYNLDGFDIDYEPNFGAPGNLASYPARMLKFVQVLGARIGPKSGTGKLFVVDGEPQSMPPQSGPYFDYFIVQAYAASGDANLDSRLSTTINNYKNVLTGEEVAKKYIVTENFESYALNGGVSFTDRYGKKMQSLEGMARWTPVINGKRVAKGGAGTYHMEYEYTVSGKPGTYPFLRQAMQIMNPPVR